MIQKLSHATVHVLDQDRALRFYRDQLGFEVRTDATMGAFRWLTVGPKSQPELEIILMTAATMRELVTKGTFGIGVFETADVRGDYEELKRKGVQFASPPTERPYGVECVVKDSEGNWFSLTQRGS